MKYLRLAVPALALLAMAAPAPFAAPALAQRQERVLTIFGKDPCPTSNGEEIVVCRRLPEGERYRIPQDLRRTEGNGRETWGDRAASLEYVGKSGVNSAAYRTSAASVLSSSDSRENGKTLRMGRTCVSTFSASLTKVEVGY